MLTPSPGHDFRAPRADRPPKIDGPTIEMQPPENFPAVCPPPPARRLRCGLRLGRLHRNGPNPPRPGSIRPSDCPEDIQWVCSCALTMAPAFTCLAETREVATATVTGPASPPPVDATCMLALSRRGIRLPATARRRGEYEYSFWAMVRQNGLCHAPWNVHFLPPERIRSRSLASCRPHWRASRLCTAGAVRAKAFFEAPECDARGNGRGDFRGVFAGSMRRVGEALRRGRVRQPRRRLDTCSLDRALFEPRCDSGKSLRKSRASRSKAG